jgi:hypothetical protein
MIRLHIKAFLDFSKPVYTLRLLKLALAVFLSVSTIASLMLAYYAHRTRQDAQHFLLDIQKLQIGHSTTADVQSMQRKYVAYVLSESSACCYTSLESMNMRLYALLEASDGEYHIC